MDNNSLKIHAKNIRKNILKMIAKANSGHPGGSLSIADILTVLYFEKMNIDPQNPQMGNRDRLVLSKGHAAPAVYATLCERGYVCPTEMESLRQVDAMLQGHPDMKGTPGVDMSTGSLGQGLSAAVGMAMSSKYQEQNYYVYAILGDGECQEGQIWEAAMAGAHYKLNNLIAFLDNNGLQIDGKNCDVMGVDPLNEKFKTFGWNVIEIDGHNFEEISNAVDAAKIVTDKPTMIIAKTAKGKGVSFMENQAGWHGVAPTAEELTKALDEIERG